MGGTFLGTERTMFALPARLGNARLPRFYATHPFAVASFAPASHSTAVSGVVMPLSENMDTFGSAPSNPVLSLSKHGLHPPRTLRQAQGWVAGMTAVASISTLARSSTSATTCTSVMVG